MTLDIHQFACLSDNYGFLLRDGATGQVGGVMRRLLADRLTGRAVHPPWPPAHLAEQCCQRRDDNRADEKGVQE